MIYEMLLNAYEARTGAKPDAGVVDMLGAITDFVESDPEQKSATLIEIELLTHILQDASKALFAK